MKLVIDTNALQDPSLKTFLEESPKNFAFITDYAKRELQKTASIEKIRLSLKTLSEFPDQVIFLKGTKEATRSSGRLSGLQKRLIHIEETQYFKKLCGWLYGESKSDLMFQKEFVKHSLREKEFLESLTRNMEETIEIFSDLKTRYSDVDLKSLRQNGYADTSQNIALLLSFMSILTTQISDKVPGGLKWPQKHEWPNMFIYRISLFYSLHFQEWLINGCPKNVKPERLRNDSIDINFATFATFFDGLMTNDKKCFDRYIEGQFILNEYLIPALKRKNK